MALIPSQPARHLGAMERYLCTALIALVVAVPAAAQSHAPSAGPHTPAAKAPPGAPARPAAPAAVRHDAPSPPGEAPHEAPAKKTPKVSSAALPARDAGGAATAGPHTALPPASPPASSGYVATSARAKGGAHGAAKKKPVVSGAEALRAATSRAHGAPAAPAAHAAESPGAVPAQGGTPAPASGDGGPPAAAPRGHSAAGKAMRLADVHQRLAAALAEARVQGAPGTSAGERARGGEPAAVLPAGAAPATPAPRVSLTWPGPRWRLSWPESASALAAPLPATPADALALPGAPPRIPPR